MGSIQANGLKSNGTLSLWPTDSINWQICLHQFRPAGGLNQSGFVSADGDARHVAKLSIVQAKCPEVPRANDAPILHFATSQIPAGMGAVIVDDKDIPAVQKHGQLKPADLDILTLALQKLVDVA
jgi:hypothetical protein